MPSVPIVPLRFSFSTLACVVAAYRSVLGDPGRFFRETWPWTAVYLGMSALGAKPVRTLIGLTGSTADDGWWRLGGLVFVECVIQFVEIGSLAGAAVSWQRWIILRERRQGFAKLQFGLRELKFLGALLTSIVLGMLLVFFAQWVVYIPFLSGDLWPFLPQDAGYVVEFLSLLVVARFILVFPLTALGERRTLVTSWRLTRGRFWQCLVLLFFATVPFYSVGEALDGWRDAIAAPGDGVIFTLLILIGDSLDMVPICVAAAAASFALIALRSSPSMPDQLRPNNLD